MSQTRSPKRLTAAITAACLVTSPAWMLTGCKNEKNDGNPVILEVGSNTGVTPTGTTQQSFATVISVLPAADAKDVELGASMQLIFSDDLLATTVTADNISLLDSEGNAIPVVLSFDGSRTVTLTPETALKALSRFQLAVSTGLSTQTGTSLEAAYQSSFTTRDGEWLITQPVEFNNQGAADLPSADFDAAGNATVVWQQDDGTGNLDVWLNRFDLEKGWGVPERVESSAADGTDAQLAVDGEGNTAIVWLQDNGDGTQSLMGRLYDAESGEWSDIATLDDPTLADVNDPAMDANSAGFGIVAWAQDDGTGSYSIAVRRYNADTGLTDIALLESADGTASAPAVGVGEDGSAIVVWAQQETSGNIGIWASRLDPATGVWSQPELIEARADAGAKPHVAVDPEGNAVAAWLQTDSSGTVNVWANRFEPESGWGQALLIEFLNGDADSPFVSVNDQGDFKIVWSQDDGEGTSDIMSNGYSPDTGWGSPVLLEENDGDALAPRVDLDDSGHGIAIWQQDDGTGDSSIWVSRYVADQGWETPETIESGNGDANAPYIAIDGEGNALAVWQQTDDSGASILANRFTMTPSTAADSTAPTVATTEPLSGATGVEPTVTIRLVFSEPVQSGGVPTSIMLEKNGVVVPASVAFDGTTGVTLTPGSELDLSTRYTLRVTEGVRDLAGNPLENEYTLSFTTREAVWRETTTVEDNDGAAYFSDVAMSNDGGAIAVWTQSVGGPVTQVWANAYQLGSGWSSAVRIDNSEHYADAPAIRFDVDGNAVAVWLQDNGLFSFDVWANVYTAGQGWGSAQVIDSGDGSAGTPQLLIAKDGTALVTWAQDVGATEVGVFVNAYNPNAKTWGAAQRIDAGGGIADDPMLAVDATGDRAVVWSQSNGGANADIWSNRFTAGVGWATARAIDLADGQAREAQVAMDAQGNAMAIWRQDDGDGRYSVWQNRFAVGAGWGTAGLIEQAAGDADDLRVVSDDEGNALALWTQLNESGFYDIYMALYSADDGWQTPELLETREGEAYSTDIAVSNDGELVVVWHQKESAGIYNIWALRYSEDLGWSEPEIIEEGAGSARNPSVAINSQGVAVAVWIQEQGGIDSVFANEFK